MDEFKSLILGPVTVWYYLAAEVFALIAIVISLYSQSLKRDVCSPSTPVNFSHKFLFLDNVKRILIGQLVLFLLFRFITELTGKQLTMWAAVGIGFTLSLGIDKVIQFLKSFSPSLQQNRGKLMDKIAPGEAPAENKCDATG